MIGAGAGLSLLPASTVLRARRSTAQTNGAGPEILAGDEFPIGLWWPPPPAQTNDARYAQIAAANFNFVIGGNGVNNTANNNSLALDASEANGLRFDLTDGSPETKGSLQYLISTAPPTLPQALQKKRRRVSTSNSSRRSPPIPSPVPRSSPPTLRKMR